MMAGCLQVPMVPSLRSSFDSASSSSINNKISWRNRNVSKRFNCRCSKVPLPPLNPNDPFLKRLASFVQANPRAKPSSKSGIPPYLDLFVKPKGSFPAQGEGYDGGSYSYHKPRSPPPDLPSVLFDSRIIFLGMPMVPAVSELLIAQFMYLQWVDDKEPIFLYINSTGTTRDDDQIVAHDTEGFAIYDAMMGVKNDVYTVACGACMGHACLLLAAGKKGQRYMLPHLRLAMKPPRISPTGLMQASDIEIQAREAGVLREMLIGLFAAHTYNTYETVEEKMRFPFYMGAREALEFNVVDKILFEGLEDSMPELLTPEQWDKMSGIKARD